MISILNKHINFSGDEFPILKHWMKFQNEVLLYLNEKTSLIVKTDRRYKLTCRLGFLSLNCWEYNDDTFVKVFDGEVVLSNKIFKRYNKSLSKQLEISPDRKFPILKSFHNEPKHVVMFIDENTGITIHVTDGRYLFSIGDLSESYANINNAVNPWDDFNGEVILKNK